MGPFDVRYNYESNEYSIGKLPESVFIAIIEALHDKKEFEWLAQIISEDQINAKKEAEKAVED